MFPCGAFNVSIPLFYTLVGTIAGRYTDANVDEMLKPDADVEVFKERLLELRKRVKRDIYAWTKSFVNEFQRQPNKQERKDVAGAMFKAYSGVRFSLSFLSFPSLSEYRFTPLI